MKIIKDNEDNEDLDNQAPAHPGSTSLLGTRASCATMMEDKNEDDNEDKDEDAEDNNEDDD